MQCAHRAELTATPPHHAALARTVGSGLLLAACLALPRAAGLLCPANACSPVRIHQWAWGTIADLAYVTGLTALVAVACLAARRRPALLRGLQWGFVGIGAVSILAAWANPIALRELGHPVSYQWLYYSDFLLSLDAYNSLYGLLSWSLVAQTAIAFVLTLTAGAAVGKWLMRRSVWPSRRPGIVLGLVAVPALAATIWLHGSTPASWAKTANPVVFFMRSLLGGGAPVFGRAVSPVPPDDFLPVADRVRAARATAFPAPPAVKNVLVVVLESVGAQSVGLYAAKSGLTPELDAYRHQARIYARAYAHVPSTMHTLVSLLSSAYHPHSFRILTREAPQAPLPAISDVLHRRGYRTAFFNSADNRFQRGDEFLRNRRFDTVVDHRGISCPGGTLHARQKDWPLLDGVYDHCTAAALLDWIRQSDAPFFAVLWTMQTHYPYFAATEGAFAPGRARLNRYFSGLVETDRAVGKLLRDLDDRGLLDSTLVVVLGDHGEGLGKHWHFVHSTLYEEDVHIPLMLINRTLFRGEIDSTVVGIVDVSPTIVDLLGMPPEPSWQGRSAFDPVRSGRAYLFAPFSGVMFGLVEDSRKFIYNAGAGTWEVYDLRNDPGELANVADRTPYLASRRHRLASWYAYQQSYYRRMLEPREE
jgi:arylsulfatase A-like enzyme